MQERSYRWLVFTLGFLVFTADQASKYGVFNWLYVPEQQTGSQEIIPGMFNLLVQFEKNHKVPFESALSRWNGPVPPQVNHGALFSLGGQYKGDANLFFAVISVIAAIGITIWAFRKDTAKDRWLCFALGLILGGTTGNMFDRFIFGGVRDFLNFYLINWPVFNIADCGLVVGAGVLLLQAIFTKPPTPETTIPATTSATAPS